ncbi:MAG: DNA gyrase subunit A [Nanoarchaeota archaeon]
MEKDEKPTDVSQGNVISQVIEDEMKTAYLDYAMSVIVGRALPDARDGLKPVHRRILYAMNDMGLHFNTSFKKCARIVGEVLGKYHPHGDVAVYDALVRMAQDFSLRYPLVKGQGNFGSIDGDNAAAMRYTEAKLAKIADEILVDIDKETVDFTDNFDGSLKEPSVLPAKLPNLLINGSSGIAVGMATNIPPHNLVEVSSAVVAMIDDPSVGTDALLQIMPGPDFPTGGTIMGRQGILNAYHSGRGKMSVRARMSVEENKTRQRLVITEIPFMVGKSSLIEEMADSVRDKVIEGISDIRDESDRNGMRIVVELKQGVEPDVVRNQLYKHTRLQSTFGIIFLALVENQPRILSLRQMLSEFIKHRQQVIRRRTQFEKRKAEERVHILDGLLIALRSIDAVIALLKKAKQVADAKVALMSSFKLSDLQAQAILDMRLQRLTALEQDKIRDEHKGLVALIAELNEILASEERILGIIKNDCLELKEKYGEARKTDFSEEDVDLDMEDLIAAEDQVVNLSHLGYIKRMPLEAYRLQRRGGVGVIGTTHTDDDFVEHVFIANTHSHLLCFTDQGQLHWLKVYRIPEGSRYSKGKAIVNLLELKAGERITSVVPIKDFSSGYLVLVTRNGLIKKTQLSAFSNPRHGGIKAIRLLEGDSLISAFATDGEQTILIATADGKAARFSEDDVRPQGRTSQGVKGVRLKPRDRVVAAVIANETDTLLTITRNGFGKRTRVDEYRLIGRGGQGVRNIICDERNGMVVAVRTVSDDDELIVMSKNGIAIRIDAQNVSVIGRNTKGLRIMRLKEGDEVVGVAKIVAQDE